MSWTSGIVSAHNHGGMTRLPVGKKGITYMIRALRTSYRRVRCCLSTVTALSLILGSVSVAVGAERAPTLGEARAMNQDTVGIVFHEEDFYRRLVADMATVLGDEHDVRIVPVIGGSYLQCVYDLLYLRGIDLTVTHADALEYIARTQGYFRVFDRVRAVAQLYDERFALIARDGVESVQDLRDARVNFGYVGGGSDISGTILFDTLGIPVEPTRLDKYDALEQVKSGELDAVLFLIEDPVDALTALGPDDGVRVLPIEPVPALLNQYNAATLTTDDFPKLLEGEQTIETLAVPVIIASYNWPSSVGWRHAKLERFVDGLVTSLDRLQQGEFEPAWEAVDLGGEAPGVSRLGMIDVALAEEREQNERAEAEARASEIAAREAERNRLRAAVQQRIDALLADSPDPERLEALLQELEEQPQLQITAGTQ